MTKSLEDLRSSWSTIKSRKKLRAAKERKLRKEIQPRKVRRKVEHMSWFSLMYKFLFQLNLNYQPRVWLYEKHTRPYGFCYTPEPRFSPPNLLSGLSFGTIYMQRRQEQGPERGCTLPFDTKMEVCLRASVQWTLWSCWKVGHKPAMWFPEPWSYNLMLPKANAVTHSSDPTPSLHLLPSPAHTATAILCCKSWLRKWSSLSL